MKKAKVNKNAPRNATPVDAYISARMRERRLALNMSQHELGRALGVSFQQIQKYERGYNRVSAARLFDICKVFNVSLSSMFERDPGGTKRKLRRGPMTVWIYVDTNKEVGDVDHLKVFATPEFADEWFKENDPEGVAFGYEIIGDETGPSKRC
jgi:transcriptional regulator with XRE-family HTH domain